MKKYFLLFLAFQLIYFLHLKAQDCNECRYLSPVFDSVTVSTVAFGEGYNIDGVNQQLLMDIYEPYGDTSTKRPVMIFAFGGGFVQGSREDWYVKEVCNHFAKAGYVSVAPDYRIGIDYGEILALQHMRIFFRPMQDMRACVQYLKADFSELGNNYLIDTSYIFIGGASAGAITSLMTAYCDKDLEMAEMGDLAALDDLGGFYSTTGYYPNYTWNGCATINVSGAMINADWIEAGDVPIISAHGNADDVVPYGYGGLGGITFGVFDLQGSHIIDSVATAKGVCSYLYTMEGQGHPSESMGLDYIKSVVYRLSLRAHAVLMNRSFCCPLSVDIEGDTLFHWTDQAPVSATLAAGIANDNGSATLQWCTIPCFPFTDNGDEITLTPDTNLKHVMAIAFEGGCEASDLYIVTDTAFVPESINEYEKLIDFLVYPQPASREITISAELPVNSGKQLRIELFNIKGQSVFAQHFSANKKLKTTIETIEFPSGNYLLRLKSENEVLGTKKIIITR